MKRLIGWLQALVRLLGGITTALLLLLLLGSGWLLLSGSGLRFAVQTAELIAGPALRVERAEGRLLGTMHLSGIRSETAAADVAILFFRCRIGVGVTEDVGLADSPPACIGVGVRLVHLAVLALRAAAVSREERPGSRALESHEVARVLGTVESISAMR